VLALEVVGGVGSVGGEVGPLRLFKLVAAGGVEK